jgi:hypothetical protein
VATRGVPHRGPPPVWVDFNRPGGDVVWLDLPVTKGELARLGLELRAGLVLNVWTEDLGDDGERDDLVAVGVVERNISRDTWQLRIGWWAHESEFAVANDGFIEAWVSLSETHTSEERE